MYKYNVKIKNKNTILALGPESDGNFSIFCNGVIYYSNNFKDLINEENFKKFEENILKFLKEKNIKPKIIISDIHPLFKTTNLATKLSERFNAKHIMVQHHIAHIFSAIGEHIIDKKINKLPNNLFGIAMDGTGYGLDKKIWGGEIFKVSKLSTHNNNSKNKTYIKKIGKLEDQVLLGGELAIKEPARMIIAILNNFLNKDKTYRYVKKYYTENEFNLLYNQLQQNFNCEKTSSTARILDAVSVLLGFSKNERKYKHQATNILEQESTIPYNDIDVKILSIKNAPHTINTTHLFKYLIKNIKNDKQRLASTAQHYISNSFCKIIDIENKNNDIVFASGGITKNKIISRKLRSEKIITNMKIPCGDNGLSVGQIFYTILNK